MSDDNVKVEERKKNCKIKHASFVCDLFDTFMSANMQIALVS